MLESPRNVGAEIAANAIAALAIHANRALDRAGGAASASTSGTMDVLANGREWRSTAGAVVDTRVVGTRMNVRRVGEAGATTTRVNGVTQDVTPAISRSRTSVQPHASDSVRSVATTCAPVTSK